MEIPSFEPEDNGSGRRFEIFAALALAVFAALLAMTDLGAGKYGDEEIIGTNAKANVYAWYQAKSVKQSLVEGQRDLILTLMTSGAIREEELSNLQHHVQKLDKEIGRYKMEKRELLLGSEVVGRENWVQELDGELGRIVGAREYEKRLEALGRAGDVFDIAVLFLQLCLVVGAVSLVIRERKLKWAFYGGMVLMGGIGAAFSLRAFLFALSA